jgi:hypothetical protein
MILTVAPRNEDRSSETDLEYAARLWLRTALAAWLLWLVPLALAVAAGMWR